MKWLMFSEWLKEYHNIDHDEVDASVRNSYKKEYREYLISTSLKVLI